jgi:hypothetical protein
MTEREGGKRSYTPIPINPPRKHNRHRTDVLHIPVQQFDVLPLPSEIRRMGRAGQVPACVEDVKLGFESWVGRDLTALCGMVNIIREEVGRRERSSLDLTKANASMDVQLFCFITTDKSKGFLESYRCPDASLQYAHTTVALLEIPI